MCWKGGRVVRQGHLVSIKSNFRAALSPQRRAVIRDKRGPLRDVGASARRAHPAPHLAATLPVARSLQGVGLSHPVALRALAPLRAGSRGGAAERLRAGLAVELLSHVRQPSARSRTPLTIRTEVGSRNSARAPSPHGCAFGSGFIVGSCGATHRCVPLSCSSRAPAQCACRVGGRAACPPSRP